VLCVYVLLTYFLLAYFYNRKVKNLRRCCRAAYSNTL